MSRAGQLHRERRRVRDPARALGRDVPDVERRGHELVGVDVVVERQALALALRPATWPRSKRPLLAMTTRSVTSRSTGFAALRNEPHAQLPAAPSPLRQMTSPRSSRPSSSWRMRDDVGGQAAVRLAAEVGDVHRDAPARLELARALGEHVGEQLEVLAVRARHAFAFEFLFVLLAREVRRRRDDQRDGAVVDRVHVAGVAEHERVGDLVRRDDRVVVGELGRARSGRRTRSRRGSRACRRRSSRWRPRFFAVAIGTAYAGVRHRPAPHVALCGRSALIGPDHVPLAIRRRLRPGALGASRSSRPRLRT